MGSLGSFTAAYGPPNNLMTNSTMNLPDVTGGDLGPSWNELLNLRARARARDQVAALGQAPRPAPYQMSQEQRFWTNKKDFDAVQSRDPWTGRAHGQAVGLEYFNMPAASALTFGKDIFPNGFETQAQLLGAAGGVNPGAQAKFGENKAWGQGY